MKFPDGVGFYPDVQGGVRGYNTDPKRGADTFSPFKNDIHLAWIAAAQYFYDGSKDTGMYTDIDVTDFKTLYFDIAVKGRNSWIRYSLKIFDMSDSNNVQIYAKTGEYTNPINTAESIIESGISIDISQYSKIRFEINANLNIQYMGFRNVVISTS